MQGSILARLGRGRSGSWFRRDAGPTDNSANGGAPSANGTGGLRTANSAEPGEPQPCPRHGKKKWRWLLVGLAVAAFVAWILRERLGHTPFEWKVFLASFVHLDWRWMVLAVLLSLATYYGRALRWAILLRPLQPKPNTWSIFKATAIGFTAVVLLGRPGEFVRPYLISLKERVPLSSQLAAWVLERLCDLLAVFLVFGFAVSQIQTSRAGLDKPFRWVLEAGGYTVGILGLICLVLLVALGRFSGAVRRRLLDALRFLPSRYYERAERVITAFVDGTAATKTQGSVAMLGVYTVLEWLLIILCFMCMFRACRETAAFTLQDALIVLGFVAFGSVVQIPGVGGGMQIVSIVVLRELYGIPLESATSFAIVIWFITFVAIVPAGLLLAFHEGINWRKFRELECRAMRASSALEPAVGDESAEP
jgi:uncharacterized protein (TIRG00374 family)